MNCRFMFNSGFSSPYPEKLSERLALKCCIGNKRTLIRPQAAQARVTRERVITRCLYWHLREMLGLIHLFQLYASPIDKTILANGIF